MNKLLITTALICTAGLSVDSAFAQNMDYGSMQEMFGEPVTTSANGSPMRASDAPLNMTIISAEEIERFPARNIPDILRHYAGVSVRQNTATDYSVGVRGYNQPGAERLLVLVNGRQVFEDYYGLVNWSNIPVELNEIRQIEVVRGPNTALFGFNATSGVVNIITLNPLYDDLDVVEFDAGANGYRRASGSYTFQNDDGNWAARVSGSGFNVDENDNDFVASESAAFRNDAESRKLNGDIVMQLNESTSARFEVSSSSLDQNLLNAFYSGNGNETDTQSIKMNISSDTEYGIIDATVYRNSIETAYNLGTGVFTFNNDVIVAQLSNTMKVGTDHTVRLAGELRNNVSDTTFSGFDLGTTTFNMKSFSGLWYWNINDKLSMSTAARYDHVASDFDGSTAGSPFSNSEYNNVYNEFGYNWGLVYKATDLDTVRLTIAKGVDLASSVETGLIFAPASLFGNPNVDVSDVHDFQIGYDRALPDYNGALRASIFYQRIDELQGFVDGTAFGVGSVGGTIGDSEAYGIEIGVDGETDGGIRWGLNYSYSNVKDDYSDTTAASYDDLNSNHMVNARIGYSPNESWDYDLYASYQSDFDSERSTGATTSTVVGVDPEVILDARIAYQPIDDLTVSLNGQAILGDNEQSAYGEETDSQVFLRAKYEF